MSGGKATVQNGPKPDDSICELPYATLQRLGNRLDMPCGGNQLYWRLLIEALPEGMYDQLTVNRFAMNANRLDGSPGYALLTDMGNRGVTFQQIVGYLKKMQFDLALRELGYKGESLLPSMQSVLVVSCHVQSKLISRDSQRPNQLWWDRNWCWSVRLLVSLSPSSSGSERRPLYPPRPLIGGCGLPYLTSSVC